MDVFSEANRMAALLREIHEAFTRLGFTEEQAFELTKLAMTGMIGGAEE